MKKIIQIVMLLVVASYAQAAEALITPDGTYIYEKRDTCDLFLDVYQPHN